MTITDTLPAELLFDPNLSSPDELIYTIEITNFGPSDANEVLLNTLGQFGPTGTATGPPPVVPLLN